MSRYPDSDIYREFGSGLAQDQVGPRDKTCEEWAARISADFSPRRVLILECSFEDLARALKARGIEVAGGNVSGYAVGKAQDEPNPTADSDSIVNLIEGKFDLAVGIDFVEHVTTEEGVKVIESLCMFARVVLFSAPPQNIGFGQFNYPSSLSWLKSFAQSGFGPRVDYDATYLSPCAMLFESRAEPPGIEELQACAKVLEARLALAQRLDEVRGSQAEADFWKAEANRAAEEAQQARETSVHLQAVLDSVLTSTSWRVTRPLRQVFAPRPRAARFLRQTAKLVWWTATFQLPSRLRARRPVLPDPQSTPARSDYEKWIERYDFSLERDKTFYLEQINGIQNKPLISVLMPVYNTNPSHLLVAIESVRHQLYPNWELCIADDCSSDLDVEQILSRYIDDPRVKTVRRSTNGHISEATNSAFDLATGPFIALLDHDDVLREHALAEVAIAINKNPGVQLIYSDEDKLDDGGRRYDPHFKPDFSPDLFLSQNYLNHLTVHTAENIRRVGGWRKGFEGSQDYDLNLRIIEAISPSQIVHIPKVLYHWRASAGSTAKEGGEKNYAYGAGLLALQDHIARTGLEAEVMPVADLPVYRVRYKLPESAPLVSLIIPTKDQVDVLKRCIDSILELTTYPKYEILIIDNDSSESRTFQFFDDLANNPRIRVLKYGGPFNYSAINNFAVRESKGEVLGLLNNDVEVINADWLDEMVSQVQRPGVGCVGAKLYYPDDTVQHAGVILGVGGVAAHSHRRFERRDPGYFCRIKVCHNVSAVTGACLFVLRSVFDQVGGLDEIRLPVAFNDVDFCMKVSDAGYWNVFTPFAELYHHESLSRGSDDTPAKRDRLLKEVHTMRLRWGRRLKHDPFYSPNLTLERDNFGIRT